MSVVVLGVGSELLIERAGGADIILSTPEGHVIRFDGLSRVMLVVHPHPHPIPKPKRTRKRKEVPDAADVRE